MSTSFYNVEALIRARLVANWDEDAIPIKYNNQKMDPDIGVPFIDFRVLPVKNEQASIGGGTSDNLHRITGVIYFNIFVQSNIGTKKILEIMDSLTTIFKNQTFNDVNVFDVRFGAEISDVSGNWYSKALTFTFNYDYN